MPTDPIVVNAEVLNSWKEVAVYLGRGVRTVQRWEMELGLPVRRPHGRSRSAVIALKPEIDRWLANTPGDVPAKERNGTKPVKVLAHQHKLHDNTHLLLTQTHQLLERSADLSARSRLLCEQINRALTLTSKLSAKKSTLPPRNDGLFTRRLS
jgi:hypothetical protein